MATRLLPDRAEAVRRLAAVLGPAGDGQLADPPADQLRWSRPDRVVPGWVDGAVRLLRDAPGRLRATAQPVGDGAVAVWCTGPGWTILARIRDDAVLGAVLVADALPGAVTDLTVPLLLDRVAPALVALAGPACGGRE